MGAKKNSAYADAISKLEVVDGEPNFEGIELSELDESVSRCIVLEASKEDLLRIRPASSPSSAMPQPPPRYMFFSVANAPLRCSLACERGRRRREAPPRCLGVSIFASASPRPASRGRRRGTSFRTASASSSSCSGQHYGGELLSEYHTRPAQEAEQEQ